MKAKRFELVAGLLACVALIPTIAEGQVNSWNNSASGTWDWQDSGNWSAGAPSSGQSCFITNFVNALSGFRFKTVNINGTTSGSFPTTMTVSNLTVSAPGGGVGPGASHNTVFLNDAGLATPLNIINTLTITSGGAVNITNSVLHVVRIMDDSIITLNTGSIVVTNGVVVVGNPGAGSLRIDDGSLLAHDVYAGGYSSGETGGVGQLTILNGALTANTVNVGTSAGQGTLTLAGGGVQANNGLLVGFGGAGAVWVNGGQLSGAMSLGTGATGTGQATVSNGMMLATGVIVGHSFGGVGTLTVAGGTCSISGSLAISLSLLGTIAPGEGTVWVTGGQLTVTNGQTVIGDGGSLGEMTVSNGTWLARDVAVGAIFTNTFSDGVLTIAGGTSSVASNLTIGGTYCVSAGILNVVGGELDVTNAAHTAVLVVGFGQVKQSGGSLIIDKLAFTNACGQFIQTGGTLTSLGSVQVDQGTQAVMGGTTEISSNLVIGSTGGATGTVIRGGGVLLVTNGVIGVGNNGTTTGSGGVGLLTISNSDVIANAVLLGSSGGGSGSLTLRPGGRLLQANSTCPPGVVCKLASNDVLLDGGTIDFANAALTIGENHPSTVTISNGVATFRTAYVGFNNTGTLTLPGGSMTVLSNMVVGDCGASVTGVVAISGGSLFVTNAAGNAVMEIRNQSVTLSAGLLKVDKLVMTNACASFIRTGGALIYGTAVLDPSRDDDGDGIPNGYEQSHGLDPLNPTDAALDSDGDGLSNLQEFQAGTDATNSASAFRITSIVRSNNDINVTWTAGVGKTNRVQVTAGASGGSYSNNFIDLSPPIEIIGLSLVSSTNYLDVGGATNTPARYYRVRLVP